MAKSVLYDMVVRMATDTAQFNQGMRAAAEQGAKHMRTLSLAVKATAAAFAAFTVYNFVKQMAAIAPALAKANDEIENTRLGLMALGATSLGFPGLIALSRTLGAPLKDLGALFTRFNIIRDNIGATTSELLTMTKVIAQLGRIGGASLDEVTNSSIQLTQALAQAKPNWDELRSVLESTPLVMQQLIQEMGLSSVAEFKKMVENGQMTSDRIVQAFLSMKDRVNELWKELPKTLEQATAQMTTEWTLFLDTVEKSSSIGQAWKQLIIEITDVLKRFRLQNLEGAPTTLEEHMQKLLNFTIETNEEQIKLLERSKAIVKMRLWDPANDDIIKKIDNGIEYLTSKNNQLRADETLVAKLLGNPIELEQAVEQIGYGMWRIVNDVTAFLQSVPGLLESNLGQTLLKNMAQITEGSAKLNAAAMAAEETLRTTGQLGAVEMNKQAIERIKKMDELLNAEKQKLLEDSKKPGTIGEMLKNMMPGMDDINQANKAFEKTQELIKKQEEAFKMGYPNQPVPPMFSEALAQAYKEHAQVMGEINKKRMEDMNKQLTEAGQKIQDIAKKDLPEWQQKLVELGQSHNTVIDLLDKIKAQYPETTQQVEEFRAALLQATDSARLEIFNERQAEINKNLREAAKITEDWQQYYEEIMMGPLTEKEQKLLEARQKLLDQLNKLEEAVATKKMTPEEGQEEFNKVVAQYRELKLKIQDTSEVMTEFAREAAQNMQDAFSDLFFDFMQGEFENLMDVVNNFKVAMDRVVANMLAAQALAGLLGPGYGTTTTTPGGMIGGLIKWFGQHRGGIVGIESIPRLHSGGIIKADEVPTILQRGEIVLTPRQMQALGGSKGGNVTMNIYTPDANSFKASQRQITAQMARALATSRRDM